MPVDTILAMPLIRKSTNHRWKFRVPVHELSTPSDASLELSPASLSRRKLEAIVRVKCCPADVQLQLPLPLIAIIWECLQTLVLNSSHSLSTNPLFGVSSHAPFDISNMAIAQVLHSSPAGQPDIGYTPDYDKYLARVQKRLATEKLDKSLPQGFPQKLESDLVRKLPAQIDH